MESTSMPTCDRRPMETQEPDGPSVCPVCGGPTVPLRGLLRCLRCCFVLCQGCEGVDGRD